MPGKVYNNVEDHRILDNNVVCEDVTSVALPTISFPTTTFNASGMSAAVDMPNLTRVDAMEFSIAHNNGANCALLATPGKHLLEVRAVRQRYVTSQGELGLESFKVRVTGVHVSTEKGSVEIGNPLGSTEKFSVLRYEEIVNGVTTTLIDAMAGIIRINGQSYTDQMANLLA